MKGEPRSNRCGTCARHHRTASTSYCSSKPTAVAASTRNRSVLSSVCLTSWRSAACAGRKLCPGLLQRRRRRPGDGSLELSSSFGACGDASLSDACARKLAVMKKRPERRWVGPCLASQVARLAASRSRASSSASAGGVLAEESEPVFIAEPMVTDIERLLV